MLEKANADLSKARDYTRKLLPRHHPKTILKTKSASYQKNPTNYYTQKDCQEQTEDQSHLKY